jgi:hypothetical protein
MVILLPTIQTQGNFSLKRRKIRVYNLVKIDKLPVGIIDNLNRGRFLGEKYRSPS